MYGSIGGKLVEYVKGLVSAIIPTYHRSDTIVRAVDSVLSQTYQRIECIVVNDNTPGDEYSIKLHQELGKYIENGQVIFLEQPVHKNGAAARNYGIKNAQGEFIAFLDDDDWWKPDKIEKQVKYINKFDDDCACISTLVEYYRDGRVIRKTLPYDSGKIYVKILGREIEVTTCSVLIRRTCLDDTGYFDENLKRHQEIQLLANLAYKYNIQLLPEYLTCVCIEDIESLLKIKKDFLKSVQPILERLAKSERDSIIAQHRFEIAYRKLSEKRYKSAMADLLTIIKRPKTIYKLCKRVVRRVRETRCIKK